MGDEKVKILLVEDDPGDVRLTQEALIIWNRHMLVKPLPFH